MGLLRVAMLRSPELFTCVKFMGIADHFIAGAGPAL